MADDESGLQCNKCTFINNSQRTQCEMCGNVLRVVANNINNNLFGFGNNLMMNMNSNNMFDDMFSSNSGNTFMSTTTTTSIVTTSNGTTTKETKTYVKDDKGEKSKVERVIGNRKQILETKRDNEGHIYKKKKMLKQEYNDKSVMVEEMDDDMDDFEREWKEKVHNKQEHEKFAQIEYSEPLIEDVTDSKVSIDIVEKPTTIIEEERTTIQIDENIDNVDIDVSNDTHLIIEELDENDIVPDDDDDKANEEKSNNNMDMNDKKVMQPKIEES